MRLISRRGTPEVIFSDNGSNFVGAEAELKGKLLAIDQCRLVNKLVSHGIDWRFIPPGASHRGGIWERIIRSVKRLLTALISEQTVSDEVLQTSMTEVERILNDRPLVPVYDDPDEPRSLCPSDILLLHPTPTPLDSNVSLADRYKRSWRQAQHLANTFWRRWIKEYLPTLQVRHKWTREKRDIREGDLILLVDNSPRNVWKKGIVERVLDSRDQHPRTVEVRTGNGIVRRDIRTLCLLEGDTSFD
jgi:uncharacterized protein YwbE